MLRESIILTNFLIDNRSISTDGGHVEINVQIEDTNVIIKVTDNGLGIPEIDIPRLFERFFRINRESHMLVEGTGLGLAIVKSLVEQHHGEIRVQSELGRGSVFSVLLPY